MLEPRRFMTGSPLALTGGSGADGWYVRRSGTSLQVWNSIPSDLDSPGSPDNTYAISAVSEVNVTGNGDNDTLILDNRNGYVPVVPFHFNGGTGDLDTVKLIGTTSAESYLYYDPGVGLPMVNGVYTDSELISLIPNGGGSPGAGDVIEVYGDFTGQTLVMAGDLGPYCDVVVDGAPAIRFDTSQHNGGLLTLPLGTAKAGGSLVMRTTLPSSMSGATFDLNDNAMVVDYSGTTPAVSLRQYIVNGRNAGAWTGSNGIKSTVAANDPNDLHGIGYGEASELLGITGTQTATWLGETVDATSLLVRGTWLGDANLDGTVDDTDFDLVRTSIQSYAALAPSARGAYATWSHGDFNYDGVIDENDVGLMVASYNRIRNGDFDSLPTITLQSEDPFSPHFAVLDGSADYSTAIQAELDYLDSVGGGTLVIPGTVSLGSTGLTLNGFSNIRIMADPTYGGGLSLAGAPGGDNALLMLRACSNILIEGLVFDGGGRAVNGISVLNSDHVVIDDNTFEDSVETTSVFTAAIWALGNLDNHYTNNTFQDVDQTGIRAGHTADVPSFTRGSEVEDNPVIVGNTITGVGGDGVIGHMPCALIVGNDIDMEDAYGNPAGGTAIGFSSTGADPNNNVDPVISHDIVILRNIINGAGWHAVQSNVYGGVYTEDCTVMNNIITNCGAHGVFMNCVKGWTVTGNVISECAWGGIFVWRGGSDTTIDHNNVSGCGFVADGPLHDGGIYVRINDGLNAVNAVTGLHITNNTVTGNTGWGVSLAAAVAYDDTVAHWGTGSDFLIAYNTCTDNSYADIFVTNAGYHLTLSSSDIHDNSAGTSDITL